MFCTTFATYFHVVFSLPAQIADIAYQNKAAIYDILFKASAETLITIAVDPKHLGARIGALSVLHTWGSGLTRHPHAHMIVPGGGLSLDGERWIACGPASSSPCACSRACSAGWSCRSSPPLNVQDSCISSESTPHSPMREPSRPIWRRWVTVTGWSTANAHSGDPRKFTHRVAISNRRLVALNDKGVTFKWKNYRLEGRE